jgi:UDP-N-acetylglucosamine transferase subunit ALG13
MIFVILGTQDKPFIRLLEAIDREIENGNIEDKVVVQAGCTNYKSKNMDINSLISQEMFDKMIIEAKLVITHAGVGSILTSLNHNKKVIVAAREAKYKEHTNDHQLQIRDRFVKDGYVLGAYKEDFGDLLIKFQHLH